MRSRHSLIPQKPPAAEDPVVRQIFEVAPKREQSLSEFVASIGPPWRHLASMTHWLAGA